MTTRDHQLANRRDVPWGLEPEGVAGPERGPALGSEGSKFECAASFGAIMTRIQAEARITGADLLSDEEIQAEVNVCRREMREKEGPLD